MVGKKIKIFAAILFTGLLACRSPEKAKFRTPLIDKASYILHLRDTTFFNRMPDYLSRQMFSDNDLMFFRKFSPSAGTAFHFFEGEGHPKLAAVVPPEDSLKFSRDSMGMYEGKKYYVTLMRNQPYYFFATSRYGIVTDDKNLIERLIRTLPQNFIADSLADLFKHYANAEAAGTWFIFPRYIPDHKSLYRPAYVFRNTGNVLIWDLENPGDNNYDGIAITLPPDRSLEEVFQAVEPFSVHHEHLLPAETADYLSIRFDIFEHFYDAWTDFKTYGGYRNDPFPVQKWKKLKAVTQAGKKGEILITRFSSSPEKLSENLEEAFRYGEITVYRSADSSNLASLFYPLLVKNNYPYVALTDNDWIWTQDAAIMKKVLRDINDNRTFDKSPLYRKARTRISPDDHLTGKTQNKFYNLRREDDILFTGLTVVTEESASSSKSWKETGRFDAGNDFSAPPQWIFNHRSRKYEIIFQNRNRNLRLITAKGKQRWKIQLNRPVTGRFYEADISGNGKRQILFSTSSGIYAVDMKGKFVPPYPLHRSLEAPLAVFDYDGNKRYRLFIVEDNKVKALDIQGRPVKGFKEVRLTAPLQFAPQHIRIGTKDYILLQQIDGTLRILNRRGEDRIRPEQKIPVRQAWQQHKNRFVSIDTAGRLVEIDQKGNIRIRKNFGKITAAAFSPRHSLIIADNKLLIDGKPTSLPPSRYDFPSIITKNGETWYVAGDRTSKKIFIKRSKGKWEEVPGDYQAELLIKPRYLYLLTRYNPEEIIIYARKK